MLESEFQAILIKELKSLIPGCVVLKNDPNYIQGFPDLLVLHKTRWVALEVKRDYFATYRPNQEYYLDLLDAMAFAAVIFPGNKDEVLNEVKKYLGSRR